MNVFDHQIATHFNGLTRRSWAFDQTIAFLSSNHLIKGGALMVFFWWLWFKSKDRDSLDRNYILTTLFSCVIALGAGRMLVLSLPFRERPLREADLNFHLPFGVAQSALDGLSSFPSDHAVLFFCLAAGTFFISRPLGWLVTLYVTLVIALPRVYLGLHYPSDILAGAALGGLISVAGGRFLVRGRAISYLKRISYEAPQYFYPLFFLVTYQIADLFENTRSLIKGLFRLVS